MILMFKKRKDSLVNSFLALFVNHKSSGVEEPASQRRTGQNGSVQRGILPPRIFPIQWLRFRYTRTQTRRAGTLSALAGWCLGLFGARGLAWPTCTPSPAGVF